MQICLFSKEIAIPWIDMSSFMKGSEQERKEIAQQFGEGFKKYGFVAVSNIGVDQELVDYFYEVAKDFFALDQETKMQHFAENGLEGFIPFGKEHAKNNAAIDLKEMYQTFGLRSSLPQKSLPTSEFIPTMHKLYQQLERSVKQCLIATAISLGYEGEEETILADLIGNNNSLMRVLHYPPVEEQYAKQGCIRAAAHEDIDMMTIIPKPTQRGLQIQPKGSNEWYDVVIPKGAAVINAGDTLMRLTNDRIPSTTHRVVNPEENDQSPRFSVPFFGQPHLLTPIRVLEKCKNNGQSHYDDTTFQEILFERLRAIGIQK